jgi:REP element-mobilizing transposase RayT
MPRREPQLALALPAPATWGGRRDGAGRKPAGDRAGISHRRALAFDRRTPVHVTLRMRPHVWSLRTVRAHAILADALRAVVARPTFGVVHFSILSNHVHLVTEADSPRELANGMRAVTGRLARGLNRLMRTSGEVFADRYHAHVLRTPREARNAVEYVLGNLASHARRSGAAPPRGVDPYSSAAALGPDGLSPPVVPPRTWLLRSACGRAGEPAAAYGQAREPVAAYAQAA